MGGTNRIQEVSGGSGYMSQNALVLHFGLGAAAVADSVTITWPSGITESRYQLAVDRKYTFRELDVVAVDVSQEMAPRFQLASPRPNPSTGDASLRFALPRAASVRLRAFDVSGRLVCTLVDRVLPAGWHAVVWRRSDSKSARFASGVYMLRLEALGEVRTRKLLLIR